MENITIREIEPDDNESLAVIIRAALTEFGANKPGTVYFDPTTDQLSELFKQPGSIYYVALSGNRVVGGGGIFPSPGLNTDTCELVKMYLASEVRGMGLGKALISRCLERARIEGYKKVYLETMPELKTALGVYEKFGFIYLSGPLGNTGHFGCDRWMLKSLENSDT